MAESNTVLDGLEVFAPTLPPGSSPAADQGTESRASREGRSLDELQRERALAIVLRLIEYFSQ